MSASSSARDCGQKRRERKRRKQWPGSETKGWRGEGGGLALAARARGASGMRRDLSEALAGK